MNLLSSIVLYFKTLQVSTIVKIIKNRSILFEQERREKERRWEEVKEDKKGWFLYFLAKLYHKRFFEYILWNPAVLWDFYDPQKPLQEYNIPRELDTAARQRYNGGVHRNMGREICVGAGRWTCLLLPGMRW